MDKKICIWCGKDESKVSFDKLAHTIPKSMGGIDICINVCDTCNHFFGSPNNNKPSIETVFKETFNISRARFLAANKDVGKNKTLTHFKSIFFIVDFKKRKLDIKPGFKFRPGFQSMLCRQFKRGVFKVFLEETERQNRDALDEKYDFIREFARYDLNDLPVLYFPRVNPLFLLTVDEIQHPKLYFYNRMEFHLKEYNFFEFEILGHLFSIPVSRNYHLMIDNYLKKTIELKRGYFYPPVMLIYLTQIDLSLNILNDNKK